MYAENTLSLKSRKSYIKDACTFRFLRPHVSEIDPTSAAEGILWSKPCIKPCREYDAVYGTLDAALREDGGWSDALDRVLDQLDVGEFDSVREGWL